MKRIGSMFDYCTSLRFAGLLAIGIVLPTASGEAQEGRSIDPTAVILNGTEKTIVKEIRKVSGLSFEERKWFYDTLRAEAFRLLESEPQGDVAGRARFVLCGAIDCTPYPLKPANQPPEVKPANQPPEVKPANQPPEVLSGTSTRERVQPPKKLRSPQPKYSKIARKAKIDGVVVLNGMISVDGNVDNIVVETGLLLGVTEAVLAAVKQWKFKPAEQGGEPMAVHYNLEIKVQLR